MGVTKVLQKCHEGVAGILQGFYGVERCLNAV
jgi:hypothetical protein